MRIRFGWSAAARPSTRPPVRCCAATRSTSEPDGITYLRCGNRRRTVCESCSHQYQGDVYHVIMAGAAGGMKDVPETIAQHPLVFATLTAPSFGLVHAAKKPGQPGTRRCRPRSGSRSEAVSARPPVVVHGCPWSRRSAQVGQPLCVDCYDYAGHLVWQWYAPELWRRFTIHLSRALAHHLGISEAACRRLVRVQFAKVAEFQRRGVIHFHALIRLDGPRPRRGVPSAGRRPGPASVLAELVGPGGRSGDLRRPPRRQQRTWPGCCGSAVRSTPDRSQRRGPGGHRRRAAAPGDGGGVCGEVRHQSRGDLLATNAATRICAGSDGW